MPRCLKCGKSRDLIKLERHRIWVCRECYPWFFEKQVERAIEEKNMFTRDERVAVAVSGGKDSLALLHVLARKGYNPKPFFIDLGIEPYTRHARKIVEDVTGSLGLELEVYDLKKERGAGIPEVARATRIPPCSICGAVKRQAMNIMAKRLECNVLATGHNLDDEVAFVFSNVIDWNLEQLARQKPVLEPGQGMVKKVKPLYRVTDREVELYVDVLGLNVVKEECPLSRKAKSVDYKRVWDEIESTRRNAKWSFYSGFLKRLQPVLEERFQEKVRLVECEKCGEPTTEGRKICLVCGFFERVKNSTTQ